MKLDQLIENAAHTAIRNAGGGSLLEAGLGAIIGGAVKAAGIPTADLTPEQYRAKLGLKDHHVEMAQGAFGLFEHLGLYKPPAAHPELAKRKPVPAPAVESEER